eukprot:Selendium_serpulae@DN1851_c0_g1_i4.p1
MANALFAFTLVCLPLALLSVLTDVIESSASDVIESSASDVIENRARLIPGARNVTNPVGAIGAEYYNNLLQALPGQWPMDCTELSDYRLIRERGVGFELKDFGGQPITLSSKPGSATIAESYR